MKLLYEAQNSIEAHMILNLLEQDGLVARIDGEYLQGGVGELQAVGVVRVMVDEGDYSSARKIIEQWDAKQTEETGEKEESLPQVKRNSSLGAGVVGFALGVAAMVAYYHTPVTYDGIDYDGDGTLDEQWIYVNDRPSKTKVDRKL